MNQNVVCTSQQNIKLNRFYMRNNYTIDYWLAGAISSTTAQTAHFNHKSFEADNDRSQVYNL